LSFTPNRELLIEQFSDFTSTSAINMPIVMDLKALKTYQFLLKPHYLVNLILAASFFILKNLPHLCNAIFETCEYEMVSNYSYSY